MKNQVTITYSLKGCRGIIPTLTSQFMYSVLISELDLAKRTIQRQLEDDIPVYFSYPLNLHLSIHPRTQKIKVDYSAIKQTKEKKLVKLYLRGDMEAFSTEWMKLV
jgi:hypothetical protein